MATSTPFSGIKLADGEQYEAAKLTAHLVPKRLPSLGIGLEAIGIDEVQATFHRRPYMLCGQAILNELTDRPNPAVGPEQQPFCQPFPASRSVRQR